MSIIPLARPPWTKLGRKLESIMRKAMYEYELLEGVEHLGIALSGGKDSLTMLYLLSSLKDRGFCDFKISAFIVTGDFSCGASIQLSFLKPICDELGVDLYSIEQDQKLEKLSCYPCSRERRKLIFNKAKSVGVNTIAFGHHRDDSIETLLMNLLHKGEFAANLPKIYMKNYDITIIRPLIYVSESEIVNFANHYNFNRVTCRCPIGQNSMRKKTNHLIEYIEKTFPNTRTNLAEAARVFGSKKAETP